MLIRADDQPLFNRNSQKGSPDIYFSEIPDPFDCDPDLSRDESILQTAERARKVADEAISEIKKAIISYNPFQLMAHFGYHDHLIFDEEKESDGYAPVPQSLLEWLQALVLQIPKDELSKVLHNEPDGNVLLKVNESLNRIRQVFGLLDIDHIRLKPGDSIASKIAIQNLAFIRNDGYPSQIKKVCADLMAPLDVEFQKREGISLTEIYDFLWKIVAEIEARINSRFKEIRRIFQQGSVEGVIKSFCEITQSDPEAVSSIVQTISHDLEKIQMWMLSLINLDSYRYFYFQECDIERLFPAETDLGVIKKIMGRISLDWGSLSEQKSEHLILDNPVWKKPFISVGNGKYFLPVAGSIQSHGRQVIEELLRAHPDLEDKYRSKIRAVYLEERVEQLMRDGFSDATVYRGLKWKDSEGKNGETDIFVMFGSYAIIVECKSAAFRSRALRGDAPALKQKLKELINEPALQGQRFKKFIESNKKMLELLDVNEDRHRIDLRGLRRVICLNVTLEYTVSVATQHKLLSEIGVREMQAPPVVTVTLYELESIFQILENPIEKIHYLSRRGELQVNYDFVADELGLLALYLSTSFDFNDLSKNGIDKIVIPTLHQKLNPYFMGIETGVKCIKPQTKKSQWWGDMLLLFSKRRFHGWMEASCVFQGVGQEG